MKDLRTSTRFRRDLKRAGKRNYKLDRPHQIIDQPSSTTSWQATSYVLVWTP